MADFNVNAALAIKVGVEGEKNVEQLSGTLQKLAKNADISAGQIKQAYRQLPAQFTDIAVSLAGGQNPFMVLLQQGGQIKDQFGSIGTAFQAVTSMITPMRLAIGGAAGAVAALGYAMFEGASESRQLAKDLALTGGYAGITAGQFQGAAERIQANANTTIGSARELLSGLVASGSVGSSALEPIANAMARLQKLSGASSDDIVKDFSSMSKGVASWAAEHNRQYHFLTIAQFEYIRTLEKQGETERAMAAAGAALDDALKSRRNEVGYLEAAWSGLGRAASSAWDFMKGIGRDDKSPIQKEYESLKNYLDGIDQLRSNMRLRGQPLPDEGDKTAQDRQRLEYLKEAIRLEQKAAEVKADNAAKEQKAINDLNSGTTEAKAAANIKLRVLKEQAGSAEIIRGFELQKITLEQLHATELISYRDYVDQKLALEAQGLAEKIRVVGIEIDLEKGQQKFGVEAIQQQITINNLLAKRAELLGQLQALPVTATKDKAVDEFKVDKDRQKALDDRRKLLADQANSDEKATAKRRIQKEGELELLKLESQAINMTKAQYEALVAAKRNEIQVAQEVADMAGPQAAAHRAMAESIDEQAAAIRRLNEEQSRTAIYGAKDALRSYFDEATNAAKQTENLVTNAFKGMEDALVEFAMTGKLNFKDFANSIIKDMIRIAIQQAVLGPLVNAFGSYMGGGGAVNTGTVTGADMGAFYANGGAFGGQGEITAFADGGVVNSPTMFKFAKGVGLMGEAGPEAIMPLQRGPDGKLGVRAAGGGETNNVVVNVNVESGSTDQTASATGAAQLGKAIASAVRVELLNQKRPGGLLAA